MHPIKHHTVKTNGIDMHVAETGAGPLVLLCHGWPEFWFSWRHQLPALAQAGFRAVAPDMRGFGRTAAPADAAQYTLLHLVGDMVGLIAALGERRAIIVGHDWGAPVAWTAALLRPDVFYAVAALSVPHRGRGPAPPLQMIRAAGMENFYWIYFQTPGVAEAELEADVASTLRRIMCGAFSGDGARRGKHPLDLAPGAGLLDHVTAPERLPPWIDEAELAQFVAEFRRTGFRGGLNWYRNIDRNWELLAPWQDATIRPPALFIAGSRDAVIRGAMGERALAQMPSLVPNLVETLIIDGAGHWIQQERPAAVNAALLRFLRAAARA
jgi:pimeloyl-ACP methyl ester carboxylesterase